MQRCNFFRNTSWQPALLWVIPLTIAVLLVHGFHPAAEDGGIYTAGIYLRLHPGLFPHDAEFVRAPEAYSSFAWLTAKSSSVLHLQPAWVILLAHIITVAFSLFSVSFLSRKSGHDTGEQICTMALLAAWWTLPVAGTSLNIGDPYLTARSFSTPLSICAITFALERWRAESGHVRWRPIVLCVLSLMCVLAMHALMFGFAVSFVVFVRATMSQKWRWWLTLTVTGAFTFALLLHLAAPSESASFVRAELTRDYWFLSQWRWFELCGLPAPLLLLAVVPRDELSSAAKNLLLASLAIGVLSLAVAVAFARQDAGNHLIARLQPLRIFILLYLVLTVVLGASIMRIARRLARKWPLRRSLVWVTPGLICGTAACCMFAVQRSDFASSRHLELPWTHGVEPNPWVAAFRWCRENTKANSLFAIDASYIHLPRNDAQTFRAIAMRSVLPDQSKDGGEAAVDPALSRQWEVGMDAQTNITTMNDKARQVRLKPLGVSWIVLTSPAQTSLPCPYDNGVVKVCQLQDL